MNTKKCESCFKYNSWNGCGLFLKDSSDCSWWEEMPRKRNPNEKMIEEIIYYIFNEEVDLNDPTETIKQVTAKLQREGYNI